MTDQQADDEVRVLRVEDGWAVTRYGQPLKRFHDQNDVRALARACEWTSKYAEARSLAAWFLLNGRRTPITVRSTSGLWKAAK